MLVLFALGGTAQAADIAAAPAKHRLPVWALTPVGFSSVRNFEGHALSQAKEVLGAHYQLDVVHVASVRPRDIIDKQTPHDVNLVYGAHIELQVSTGTPPPPAVTPAVTPVDPGPPVKPTDTPTQPPAGQTVPTETSPTGTPPTEAQPAPLEPPPPPPVRMAYVPDLEGTEATQAQAYLETMGFPVIDWSWVVSDRPRGLLLVQSPKGVRAPLGSGVSFWVSTGPARPKWLMPLLGMGAVGLLGGGWLLKRALDRRRLRARLTAVRVAVDLPTPAALPRLEGRPEDRHSLELRAERGPGPPHLQPKDPL